MVKQLRARQKDTLRDDTNGPAALLENAAITDSTEVATSLRSQRIHLPYPLSQKPSEQCKQQRARILSQLHNKPPSSYLHAYFARLARISCEKQAIERNMLLGELGS